MIDLLIHHASTPDGITDIGIFEGRIVELASSITETARETMDATGLLVWPGVIDAHVHFNEPGRTEWEGLSTGSRALAAGGGTLFFDMPLNASPPTVNLAAFELKTALALEKSVTDFALWGGLVPGNLEDMEPLAKAGVMGFKAFMSGSGMADFERADFVTLKKGMQRAAALGLPVAVHAEDDELVNRLSMEAIQKGRTGVRDYLAARPIQAELNAIDAATSIAAETGCRLHIVHVSSPDGIAKIAAARAAGVDVTAETCPHFLLFNEDDVARIGAAAKCAPPIRSAEKVHGLWQDLAAGNIHTIGSDHSPSPGSMKESDDFFAIWGGIAGCQNAFPLFISRAMEDYVLDAKLLSSVLSGNVAQRFGMEHRKGSIAVGQDADLMFLRTGVRDQITKAELLYRHAISPYVDAISTVRIERTLSRGSTIWHHGQETKQHQAVLN